jgi:hypothetical protein
MRCGGHAHSSNMEAVNAGVACGCEFCWVCMGIIEPGKGHQCNSYRNSNKKKANGKDDRQTKEEELKYLSHYYERYEHHQGSRKYIERDRQAQHNNKEALSVDSTLAASVDPGYLIQACELLIEARRDLKWSYAAAFFLKPSPQKDFFEFLQGDLEQDVELLSKLLEHDVPGQVAGYEERAVHKTQTTSRMNGVRQKLDNLEFHAAQDFVSAPSASGATLMAGGATSEEYDSNDLLDRRRRRARTTPASSGRVADHFPHKPSHTHRAGSTGGSPGGGGTCAHCTYKNDAGSTCAMCGEPLTPQAARQGAATTPSPAMCPEWATPCRDGKSCTKQADETHMMQYWHPPA